MTRPAASRGGIARYADDVERPGMLHAALVRSPYAHARVARRVSRARRLRRAHARRRAGPRPLRLPGPRPDRARADRVALRRRRRRRRRGADRARGRGGGRARRGRLRGAARRLRRGRGRAAGRAAPPRAAHGLRRARPRFGVRPLAGHERLPPLPISPRRRRRGLRRGRRGRRGGVPHAERRARADGAARGARRVGGRRGSTCGRARRRRSTCARTSPACSGSPRSAIRIVAPPMGGSFGAKTFVRTEAVVGGAGAQGRPAGEGRARPHARSSSRSTATRRRSACGSAPRATARSSPRRSTAGSTPARTPTAGRASRRSSATPASGPYRIPHVRVDSLAIYTNLPPNGAYRGYGAMQSVWASERTMDVLAERLGMSPLELRARTCCATATASRTGEVMHDVHFEECLQAAADARRLRGGPARQGPVRAAQGHADAEPRRDRVERTPVGYIVRSRVVRDGPGRAALDPAHGAPSCSAASPARSSSRPGHRHARRSTRARRPAARRT